MGLMSNGYAGRPIETDDASVTALRTCQLDFWTETSLEVRQDNFNGGCNFLGNGEFSLGLRSAGDTNDGPRQTRARHPGWTTKTTACREHR